MFQRLFAPRMVTAAEALPGRASSAFPLPQHHALSGEPLQPPSPAGTRRLVLAMGCFWGAERKLWQVEGVRITAVGYAGGFTPSPTYEEVCSGRTGHTEVVLAVYDPEPNTLERLLVAFWEGHDPTQGMRQGNDVGTQYRSALYAEDEEQLARLRASREGYQQRLKAAGVGEITTEIAMAGPFWYAEEHHQQYLHKNPGGYCGLGGTGVSCGL